MQLEAKTKSQSRIKESDFLLQICKAWDYVNIRSKVIATLFAVWSLLLDLLLNRNCCKGTETTKRLLKLYKIFFLNYIDLIQSIVSIDLKKKCSDLYVSDSNDRSFSDQETLLWKWDLKTQIELWMEQCWRMQRLFKMVNYWHFLTTRQSISGSSYIWQRSKTRTDKVT